MGNKMSYEETQLQEKIHAMCTLFMRALNMSFGCFDFIVRNGDVYFLEMNANGQWAWLEKEVGVKISKSIVEYLNA